MAGTRSVYFVDSPGATVFHYFVDCPALGQAVYQIVEERIDDLAVTVATETYGDLPLCLRCKARVERDENLAADAWQDRATGHREASVAPQAPALTPYDVRSAIENAVAAVFVDPFELSEEQVAGTEPLLVVRQDLGELRIYGDRAEIDWLGTLFRGVPDIVMPYESVVDVRSLTWIPVVRTPAVFLDCVFDDEEVNEIKFGVDIRDSPEQIAAFLRELVAEWGKLGTGAPMARTPSVAEAEPITPVKAQAIQAVEEPPEPPPLPELDPAPTYADGTPPADAELYSVKRDRGTFEQADAPAESRRVYSDAGSHAVRAMALSGGRRRYPVIFVPGTGGSFLKMPGGVLAGRPPHMLDDGTFEDRWVRDLTPWIDAKIVLNREGEMRDWLNFLKLDPHGVDTIGLGIYPAGIFENWPAMDFYSGLIKRLAQEGYTEGEGWLRKFPYDFRIDPSENASRLDLLVSHTLRRTGASKVVLVSHSQGGLVARDYIVNHASGRVRASITLGAPFLGVVWCMKALMPLGWDFGQTGKVEPLVIRSLAQNWPAVYAMLPAEEWFYGHPTGFLDFIDESRGWRTDTAPQQIGFVMQHHNTELYARARAWRRRLLDGNGHGAENVVIVGDRPDSTPARYQIVRRRDGHYEERLVMERGDGTVTLGSGTLEGLGARLGPGRVYRVTANDSSGTPPDHSSLANHGGVQEIVARELSQLA